MFSVVRMRTGKKYCNNRLSSANIYVKCLELTNRCFPQISIKSCYMITEIVSNSKVFSSAFKVMKRSGMRFGCSM